MIGTQELLLILLIVLILFGASRLPALARGIGEALREFRKAASEGEKSANQAEASDEAEGGAEKPNR